MLNSTQHNLSIELTRCTIINIRGVQFKMHLPEHDLLYGFLGLDGAATTSKDNITRQPKVQK